MALADGNEGLPPFHDMLLQCLALGGGHDRPAGWESTDAQTLVGSLCAPGKTQVLPGVFASQPQRQKRRKIARPALSLTAKMAVDKLVIAGEQSVGGPLYTISPPPRINVYDATFRECLKELNVVATPGDDTTQVQVQPITRAYVMSMLEYGRRSRDFSTVLAPTCENGINDACKASTVASCMAGAFGPGPLQVYQTPSQLSTFHKTGASNDGPCLLCIWTRIARQIIVGGGGCTIIPPMTVLVNVPGEYTSKECYGPLDGIAGYIPKPSGKYVFLHNPERGIHYIQPPPAQAWTSPSSLN